MSYDNRRILLQSRLQKIRDDLGKTDLLIVSKTTTIQDIKICYELGERNFGENRVQDLLEKANVLKESCPKINWHMIGALQSNKINQLLKVPNLKYIHSIDSIKLLEKLINRIDLINEEIKFFLQINTSMEDEKSGLENLGQLEEILEYFFKQDCNENKLKFIGLMTIGKIRSNNFKEDAIKCFKELNNFKNFIDLKYNMDSKLSMGMSQDYKIAVKHNSNWVRIGSSIFAKENEDE